MKSEGSEERLQAIETYLDKGPGRYNGRFDGSKPGRRGTSSPASLAYPFSLLYFDLLIRRAKSSSIRRFQNLKALFQRKQNRLNKSDLESIRPLLSQIVQMARIPLVIDEQEPRRPLNILFLQDSPCIRNYKYADALHRRGHKVTLAYIDHRLSERYNLDEGVYEDVVHVTDFKSFWNFAESFDLIHSHNEPDLYTVLAIGSTVPVIHDTHDLISLRPETRTYRTQVLESLANTLSVGRITVSPFLLQQLDDRYGASYETVIYNYALPDEAQCEPFEKLSRVDNKVHIVYQGGLVLGHSYRDPSELFISLSKHNYQIHIYPSHYSEKVRKLFSSHPNIHYNRPVSPTQLVRELARYDVGIIPFRVTDQTREILNASLGNKLFEYLAAGLPVLTPDLVSYERFFQEHGWGVTYKDTKDLLRKLPAALAMQHPGKRFLFEQQVGPLEKFYRNCIARHEYRIGRPDFLAFIQAYCSNIHRWLAFLGTLKNRN